MILSYVPDQLLVGQICRKFYDVSCSLEGYSLTIRTQTLDGDPNMKVVEFLEDESIFSSIVNSKRKIEVLYLNELHIDPPNSQKLQIIIEIFGAGIKELNISDCKLSMAEISLLSLMPQLHTLTVLSCIKTSD
jgi:hypothetical protein